MAPSKLVALTHELALQSHHFNHAIDATCGNGHDTLFLAQYFARVDAFDIQELAIKRTQSKVSHLFHVFVHHDSFTHLDQWFSSPIDLVIYNLGFLPGTNQLITTSGVDTIQSVLQSYSLLSTNGQIIIGCYLRHPGGLEEFQLIQLTLNNKKIPFKVIPAGDFDKIILIKKTI